MRYFLLLVSLVGASAFADLSHLAVLASSVIAGHAKDVATNATQEEYDKLDKEIEETHKKLVDSSSYDKTLIEKELARMSTQPNQQALIDMPECISRKKARGEDASLTKTSGRLLFAAALPKKEKPEVAPFREEPTGPQFLFTLANETTLDYVPSWQQSNLANTNRWFIDPNQPYQSTISDGSKTTPFRVVQIEKTPLKYYGEGSTQEEPREVYSGKQIVTKELIPLSIKEGKIEWAFKYEVVVTTSVAEGGTLHRYSVICKSKQGAKG